MKNICIKNVMIISCLMSSFVIAQPASKPKLSSPIIKWLDNKPFALDVFAMGDVLHVRREVRKIQFGIQDPSTKKFVGFYVFEGELRTLRWLADYERALTKEFVEQKVVLDKKHVDPNSFNNEWNMKKPSMNQAFEKKMVEHCEHIKRSIFDADEYEYQLTKMQRELRTQHELTLADKEEEVKLNHIKNKDLYYRQLKGIAGVYQFKMRALDPCLQMAIADFVTANEPFALKMEGTKTMMLKLVEEFCLKYRRPYSFLLEWSNVDEGQEVVAFQKKMISCHALDEFCTDLTDFLEALYYSCEKARAEFEAKGKAKKNRQKMVAWV